MTAATNPPADAPAARRPWRRLHLSTWIIAAMVFSVLILVVVPGECIDDWGGNLVVHGWPWVFFERHFLQPLTHKNLIGNWDLESATWLDLYAWKYTGINQEFHWPAFAGDLGVVLLIFIATAFLCEWRRRRRRRFFQYTLREIFLAITVAACILSWWAVNHRRRQEEKAAAAELSELNVLCGEYYRGPVFLRKLLDRSWLDDFQAVTSCVNLGDKKNKFPVALIKHFKQLDEADIPGELSDADYQVISECTSLTQLHLSPCNVSAAQLSKIASLTNLRSLGLVDDNPITAEGIRNLLPLTNLESLNLNTTRLERDAISVLSEFRSLRDLSLCYTNLHDKDIEQFAGLQKLESLDVRRTRITPSGFQRLKRLLPNCKIGWSND
jgi:hypothetical protein